VDAQTRKTELWQERPESTHHLGRGGNRDSGARAKVGTHGARGGAQRCVDGHKDVASLLPFRRAERSGQARQGKSGGTARRAERQGQARWLRGQDARALTDERSLAGASGTARSSHTPHGRGWVSRCARAAEMSVARGAARCTRASVTTDVTAAPADWSGRRTFRPRAARRATSARGVRSSPVAVVRASRAACAGSATTPR